MRLGRLEVFLQQQRRDAEHVADVVEAVAGVVGREFLLRLEIDPHQVADRVAVLDPVEPADRHPARVGVLGIDAEDVVLDPVGQDLDLLGGRPRLAGRRHDPRTDVLEHRPPEVAPLHQRLVRPALVEGHPALLHPVGVASVAVVDQDRLDLVLEPRDGLALGSVTRRGQKHRAQRQPQPRVSSPGPSRSDPAYSVIQSLNPRLPMARGYSAGHSSRIVHGLNKNSTFVVNPGAASTSVASVGIDA